MNVVFKEGAGLIALIFWISALGFMSIALLRKVRILNRMLRSRNGMLVYGEIGHGYIIGGDKQLCVYRDIASGKEQAEAWRDVRLGKSVIPVQMTAWYDMKASPPKVGEYVILYAGEGAFCTLIGMEVMDSEACRSYLQDFTHWIPGVKPPVLT